MMNEYIVPIITDTLTAYLQVEAKTTEAAEKKAKKLLKLLASGKGVIKIEEIERV